MTYYGFVVLCINGSLKDAWKDLAPYMLNIIGMDNSVNKATVPFLAIAMVIIAAIAAKVRATRMRKVPEGYEDETGFHLTPFL